MRPERVEPLPLWARVLHVVVPGLFTVIGVAGVPDDLKQWKQWLEVLDQNTSRWLFVLSAVVVFAATDPRIRRRMRVQAAPALDFHAIAEGAAQRQSPAPEQSRTTTPAQPGRARHLTETEDARILAIAKALPSHLRWIIERLASGKPEKIYLAFADQEVLVSQLGLVRIVAILDPQNARDVIAELAPGVARAVAPLLKEIARERARRASERTRPLKKTTKF